MASCVFLGGIMWVAMGDVMIEADQVMKEPGRSVVELVAQSGRTFEIEVPQHQWFWDSAQWYSTCLDDAVAYVSHPV